MTTIVVSAAVIERDDRFLVTRRQAGVHLEGHWEFPGGKCHEGEPLAACMARELHEELNIAAEVGAEVLTTTHEYPDRRVELHFLRCVITGEPAPQQGQEMRWVRREDLVTLQFPPADEQLIEMLVAQTLTRLAIVAYPTLAKPDQQWIEEIRRTHDPLAARISAHFTVVFPVHAVPAEVAEEVSAVAALAEPIGFAVRRAQAMRDVVAAAGGHVFLLPDEGREQIVELHDRLYAGALRAHLRANIPFVPHMTVGANPDLEQCQNLAEELNRNQRVVYGVLDSVVLVNVATTPVQSIDTFRLGS